MIKIEKKFNYKVLEINNIVESIEGKFNCAYQSYTKYCIIKNQLTGDIIKINDDTNDILLKKIINFIDNNDCMVGDEFNIK
jgi:hypothetical protein